MKNIRFRKAVKLFTILTSIITLIGTAVNFGIPIYLSYKFRTNAINAGSIGIIGGADGPTTIVLAGSPPSSLFTLVFGLLSTAGLSYLFITKASKR